MMNNHVINIMDSRL